MPSSEKKFSYPPNNKASRGEEEAVPGIKKSPLFLSGEIILIVSYSYWLFSEGKYGHGILILCRPAGWKSKCIFPEELRKTCTFLSPDIPTLPSTCQCGQYILRTHDATRCFFLGNRGVSMIERTGVLFVGHVGNECECLFVCFDTNPIWRRSPPLIISSSSFSHDSEQHRKSDVANFPPFDAAALPPSPLFFSQT